MGADHCRVDIPVAQERLDGWEVIAILKPRRGTRVAESIAGDVLDNPHLASGRAEVPRKQRDPPGLSLP